MIGISLIQKMVSLLFRQHDIKREYEFQIANFVVEI